MATATTTTTETPLVTIHVKGKPVSTNHMYKPSRWGGKYLSDEAIAWQGAVWAATHEACMGIRGKRYPRVFSPDAQYRVVCTFYRVRRNADADNLLKLTLDGLKAGIHVDDRHFTVVESHISDDKSQPQGALIEVYAATEPNEAA